MTQRTDIATVSKESNEGREAYEAALARITELYGKLNQWVAKVNDPSEDDDRKSELFSALHGGFQTAWNKPPDNLVLGSNCTLTFSHHENSEGSLYIGFEHGEQRHNLRFRWLGERGKQYLEMDKGTQIVLSEQDGKATLINFKTKGNTDDRHESVWEANNDGIRTARLKPGDQRGDAYKEMYRLCSMRDTLSAKVGDVLARTLTLGKVSPAKDLQQQIEEAWRSGYLATQTFTDVPFNEVVTVLEAFIAGLEQALPDLEALWESTGGRVDAMCKDSNPINPETLMLSVTKALEDSK